MREVFIIYEKDSGNIKLASRLDKEHDKKHKNGSTATEQIERILSKNPHYDVLYMPDQVLPDIQTYKIQNNKIVKKTQKELQQRNLIEEYEDLIIQEIRKIAIENLIKSKKLPEDYI